MLSWTKQFNIFCFLDNRSYSIQPQQYECLLAVGAKEFITGDRIKALDRFLSVHQGWKFGHLSYDLKNSIHGLATEKKEKMGFPPFFFFVPEVLIRLSGNDLTIEAEDPAQVYHQIERQEIIAPSQTNLSITARLTREEYLHIIRALQQHILRGDCYEINFCQEFFAEDCFIDAAAVFEQLVELSPNPFSAFYRLNGSFLICASPERFLSKKGNRVFSQPMKGTIKRNVSDESEDRLLKNELKESAKDRSENVMVVDMVRNDLTKVCREDSVHVDELYGVYSFPQVHQMISTISGELKNEIRFSEIIEACFPMGSMTGAPKHRVMQLIDEFEISSRGIFSGSVGYIDPSGDFDFNVVIRSIMYNAVENYLSYQVGSGITFYSEAEKEWEECLLKAAAIKKVLTGGQHSL